MSHNANFALINFDAFFQFASVALLLANSVYFINYPGLAEPCSGKIAHLRTNARRTVARLQCGWSAYLPVKWHILYPGRPNYQRGEHQRLAPRYVPNYLTNAQRRTVESTVYENVSWASARLLIHLHRCQPFTIIPHL